MPALARLGDLITGGIHCHGHPHPPLPTPGRVVTASTKVFVRGRPATRTGDLGHSPLCCGGIGRIEIEQSQSKVYIEGKPAAGVGTRTTHCGMAPGQVALGCETVVIP